MLFVLVVYSILLSFGATSLKYISKLKEFKNENGEDYVTESEYFLIEKMYESVFLIANEILTGAGLNEHSFFCNDEVTGLDLKCRPDRIKGKYIIDLKTTSDISSFQKSVLKYNYHVQGAFYKDVLEQSTKKKVDGFIFIVVEKKAPYDTGIYILDDEYMEIGKIQYRIALGEMMEVSESGEYKGIMGDDSVKELKAPNWLIDKFLV